MAVRRPTSTTTDASLFSIVIPFGEVAGMEDRYRILHGVVSYYTREFFNLEVIIAQVSAQPSIGKELSDLPGVKVVHAPSDTWNPAKARNLGAVAAGREMLLFLDGDIVVPPHHILDGIKLHLTCGPNAFVSIGDVVYYVKPDVLECGNPYLGCVAQDPTRIMGHHGPACGLIRKEVYRTNGGSDERYQSWGCEDEDLIVRLGAQGVAMRAAPGPIYHIEHPPAAVKAAILNKDAISPDSEGYQDFRNNLAMLAETRKKLVIRELGKVTLNALSGCNLACVTCNQQEWRSAEPEYVMQLDELHRFLKACRESRYHFKSIALSGGEPLMWEHLDTALQLLFGSGCTSSIEVFTNGMQPDRIIALADKYPALYLRASYYGDINVPHLQKLQQSGRKNIGVADKRGHTPLPHGFVPGTLPGKCICLGYGVRSNRVFSCPQAEALLTRFPYLDTPGLVTDLSPGFADRLVDGRNHQTICAACASNIAVQQKMGSVEVDTGQVGQALG